MCRAMVNDHFTPAYLAAMTSAMAAFAVGYPALRPKHPIESGSDAPSVPGSHGSAPAAEPADTATVRTASMPSVSVAAAAIASGDVTERGRRGRSRPAIPGTAKPRPLVSDPHRPAHSHAKDA